MTGSEKVFFDTAPFIYLVENHPKYYLAVADFIADYLTEKEGIFTTSVLSIAEFGVKPKKHNNLKLQLDFENVLKELNFQITDINYAIAGLSSTLRAQYDFFKGMDALQLGTAIASNCTKFFTNDKKLKSIKELDIILIEDLI